MKEDESNKEPSISSNDQQKPKIKDLKPVVHLIKL